MHSPVSLADVMLKVLLMVFLSMTVLALIAKKNAEEGNVKKKAEFQITAEWNKTRDTQIDCDVDLWVRNPEGQIVFWRTKENALMNIERDDIGMRNDTIILADGKEINNPEDMEYWYLRGIIPGEYTVNLHLYACLKGEKAISFGNATVIPVPVEIKLIKLNPRMQLMETRTVILDTLWQEKTAFNFTLSATGEVSRITDIPMKLINGGAIP